MQKTNILWSIRGELLRKRLHRETNDRTTVLYGGTVKKMYRMNGFRPREALLSGLVMNVCACVVTYNLICVIKITLMEVFLFLIWPLPFVTGNGDSYGRFA